MSDPVSVTQQPSAWGRILAWLKAKDDAQKESAGRDVLDSVHQALPDQLSARSAIEFDRNRKKRMIDEALNGE